MYLPFFTVATNISPQPAAGSLFKRPLIPFTAITNRFLAPVLSAQFMTAPTGRPSEIRNFAPACPPRPLFDISAVYVTAQRSSKQLKFRWICTENVLPDVAYTAHADEKAFCLSEAKSKPLTPEWPPLAGCVSWLWRHRLSCLQTEMPSSSTRKPTRERATWKLFAVFTVNRVIVERTNIWYLLHSCELTVRNVHIVRPDRWLHYWGWGYDCLCVVYFELLSWFTLPGRYWITENRFR